MILCPWNDLPRYAPVIPGLMEAIEKVNGLETYETATYPLSNGGRIMVMSGTTLPADGAAEAHDKFLDIQYIVKGQEVVGWAPRQTLESVGAFDEEKDVGFFTGEFEFVRIAAGHCYVAFPEDGHMPTRHLENPNEYTKIVVKLKV